MKGPITLFFIFSLLILPSVISNSPHHRSHGLSEKIKICERVNPAQPLNSRGQSLVSNSDDTKDLVLCPGDAFGDLTETFVKLEDCYLAMYHRNILIWSSRGSEHWRTPSDSFLRHYQCVFSLERDGNLMLYKEGKVYSNSGSSYQTGQYEWDSQTNFNPVKTELKLQGQQVQIMQTFQDGTQRLFYADADHQEFVEDLGDPIKKGDKFIIKNHQDEDKTILKRNEYIGDLNSTYLIFQTNCQLQLLNKNKTLWSFIPPFRHEMNCTLNIAQNNQVEISSFLTGNRVGSFDKEHNNNFMQGPYRERIMRSNSYLEVVKSQITFEDDKPLIIQTLKNGSELVFCGMPGQNSGLNLKRELTQVALKTIALEYPISEFVDDSDDEDIFVIKRMDYIGNLTGLHLILGHNCSLILFNRDKKLWEAESELFSLDSPLMECSVKLYPYGIMRLKREFVRKSPEHQLLFGHRYLIGDNPGFITGVELTLENDQITIRLGREGLSPDIFHAGPNTDGAFFKHIAQNSIFIGSDYETLPQMGYIGDLNGIHTVLNKSCNWVLYNKTQILWESGTSRNTARSLECMLLKTGKNELEIFLSDWSPFNDPSSNSIFKEAVRAELLVNNSGLWMILTSRDGIVHNYQAIPGRNHFELVSKTNAFFVDQDL